MKVCFLLASLLVLSARNASSAFSKDERSLLMKLLKVLDGNSTGSIDKRENDAFDTDDDSFSVRSFGSGAGSGSGAGPLTEPTLKMCFDIDAKTWKAFAGNPYDYLMSVVARLNGILDESGVTLNGQPLQAALYSYLPVGAIDLNSYSSDKPTDLSAVNFGYWKNSKVVERVNARGCNTMFLLSGDQGYFSAAGARGLATVGTICSTSAHGILKMDKRPLGFKNSFIRTLAHEVGHILGAIHIDETDRITNKYSQAPSVASVCDGSCDLASGFCLMDRTARTLDEQNKFGSCAKAQFEASATSILNPDACLF